MFAGSCSVAGMIRFEDLPQVISREEASRILERSGVMGLVMRGHLKAGRLPNGLGGVTTASVKREYEWRRTATRWKRVRRRIGDVLGHLLCPLLWV